MLLGDTCTRGCMFCAVKTSAHPSPPDPFEPFKVFVIVYDWRLYEDKHSIITFLLCN